MLHPYERWAAMFAQTEDQGVDNVGPAWCCHSWAFSRVFLYFLLSLNIA
jgi:hypothetical protein